MTTRKFFLFFDGTGNGSCGGTPSNVFSLYDAFQHCKDSSVVPFYYPGPGASEYDVFVGKLLGSGIIENIKTAYKDLCRSYEEQNKIALFGFSRGAYTVHMFAWLLERCGIPTDIADCDSIVDLFIKNPQTPAIAEYKVYKNPVIDFIGVWDIVKSVFPNKDYMDEELPSNVRQAFHAMALDELRTAFPVMKWGKNDCTELHQGWFAGVHSEVGGGYAQHGLSDITYEWMKNAVEASGLISNITFPKAFCKNIKQDLNNPFMDEPLLWTALGKKKRVYDGEEVHPTVNERHMLIAEYCPEVSNWHWS